jgi:hypothetical protein
MRCNEGRVSWVAAVDGYQRLQIFDPGHATTLSFERITNFLFDFFHYYGGFWYGGKEGTPGLIRIDERAADQDPVVAEVEGNARPRVAAVDQEHIYYWAYVPNKARSFLYRGPRF